MKLKCGDSEANHKSRWSQDKEQICPVFTLYLQHIFRISTHFFINNLVSTVSNPFFRLSSHYLSNNFFWFTGCPTVSVSTLIAYIFGICWWYEISYLQLNYLWIRFSPRDSKWTDITPITGWAWWFAYRGLVDIDIDLNHSTIWLVLLGRGECKQGKIMEHPN